MRRLLVRCYPARWRARYADEFVAILEERPLGPFDVADVLLGALDAHLNLRGRPAADLRQGGVVMSVRIGGAAAVLGGLLWTVALGGSAAAGGEGAIWGWFLLAATVALLVALVGLSAFQARRFPRLIWAAFIVPAVGACVSVAGLIAMAAVGDRPVVAELSPWEVWALGTTTLTAGSTVFAIASYRAGRLSRSAAVVLAVGALTIVPMLAGLGGGLLPEPLSIVVTVVAMAAFAGGWSWIGVSAHRTRGTWPAASGGVAIP